MNQLIRIIGGAYRGKKIHFPLVKGLRPTPDRVKETLFNWLMNDIRGSRCLDAFAGSGSLGLEAFSRGAEQVVFVEQSPIVYNNLNKILSQFKTSNLKLIKANTLSYLEKASEQFDLIFLDPPFADHLIPSCLDLIYKSTLLKTGGLLYLESDEVSNLDPAQWKSIKLKKNGQVFFGLFEKL